jgi:hypothetical protein
MMAFTLIPKYNKFSSLYCEGEITPIDNDAKHDVQISGIIHDTVKDNTRYFIASNPMDRRSSFNGSGFPYANSEQAFEETPNKGSVSCAMGVQFKIPLLFPNSFYTDLGNSLIPPSLFLKWATLSGEERQATIKLGDPVPYRFLGYPEEYTMAREDATFYHAHHNLPVRSQEQVFKDSIYPHTNKMHEDFWGLKPAL